MERKNLIGKIKKILCCLSLLAFHSCYTPIQVNDDDLVGTWVADDGAELCLNRDKTFTLREFNCRFFYISYRDSSVNISGSGTWEVDSTTKFNELKLFFEEVSGRNLLSYNEDLKRAVGYAAFSLDIAGENGFWGNKPPVFLYRLNLGSDDDRYEFHRKK